MPAVGSMDYPLSGYSELDVPLQVAVPPSLSVSIDAAVRDARIGQAVLEATCSGAVDEFTALTV